MQANESRRDYDRDPHTRRDAYRGYSQSQGSRDGDHSRSWDHNRDTGYRGQQGASSADSPRYRSDAYGEQRYAGLRAGGDRSYRSDRGWNQPPRDMYRGYEPSRNYDPQSGNYRGHDAGHDRDERGFFDRASDEVSSWFGNEDAERRREMDARRERSREGYGGYETGSGSRYSGQDRDGDANRYLDSDRYRYSNNYGSSGRSRDQGAHYGRGPAGYTRSDERIREDICDRLTYDPMIDASAIEVKVAGAEVTLDGTVENRTAKRQAESIAEEIAGVSHVQNNLRVRQQTGAPSGSQSAGFGNQGSTQLGSTPGSAVDSKLASGTSTPAATPTGTTASGNKLSTGSTA